MRSRRPSPLARWCAIAANSHTTTCCSPAERRTRTSGTKSGSVTRPGLKTLSQATEIRRRVLSAFEAAERETDRARQQWLLTFVVVGGGPTGVELAGAIGEMSRYTLARDFRSIDPRQHARDSHRSRPANPAGVRRASSRRARRAISKRSACRCGRRRAVTTVIDGRRRARRRSRSAATVLWAAGVRASGRSAARSAWRWIPRAASSSGPISASPAIRTSSCSATWRMRSTQSACYRCRASRLVAMQQGIYVARSIRRSARGAAARAHFAMSTSGRWPRSAAAARSREFGRLRLGGRLRVVVLADRAYLSPQRAFATACRC